MTISQFTKQFKVIRGLSYMTGTNSFLDNVFHLIKDECTDTYGSILKTHPGQPELGETIHILEYIQKIAHQVETRLLQQYVTS